MVDDLVVLPNSLDVIIMGLLLDAPGESVVHIGLGLGFDSIWRVSQWMTRWVEVSEAWEVKGSSVNSIESLEQPLSVVSPDLSLQ